MRGIKTFLCLTIFAGTAAFATPAVSASSIIDCGAVSNNIAAQTPAHSTTSTAFVNLTDGIINFNGGSGNCVIVTVSALVRAKYPQTLRVRATLDGDVGIQPAVDFYTSETAFDGKSATFYFHSVPSGDHILRIQIRSLNGGTVTMGKGVVTIFYQPSS